MGQTSTERAPLAAIASIRLGPEPRFAGFACRLKRDAPARQFDAVRDQPATFVQAPRIVVAFGNDALRQAMGRKEDDFGGKVAQRFAQQRLHGGHERRMRVKALDEDRFVGPRRAQCDLVPAETHAREVRCKGQGDEAFDAECGSLRGAVGDERRRMLHARRTTAVPSRVPRAAACSAVT